MNILLKQQCYNWLVVLKILKPYLIPFHNSSPSHQQFIQVCYDDQIYLQNGYLIGVLLKDILKEHELYSEKLIKIRKITVLKKYQNWEIVYEVLSFLDYDEVEPPQNVTSQRQLIIYQIQNILHFLFHQYGPHSHLRTQQPKRVFHIEPQKLQKLYDKNQRNNQLDGVDNYCYKDCKNVLEYMVMAVKNAFPGINVGECLGLLVDKGKVLKDIIMKGLKDYPRKVNDTNSNTLNSNYNAYHCIQRLYQQVITSVQYFQSLIIYEPSHLSQFMSIFSIGAQSHSPQVAKLTRSLLQTVECSQWFFTEGFGVLIKSQHSQILTLIIQKSINQFAAVFNLQKLSQYFIYNQDVLLFLSRMLPIVAKSRFSKQILQSLTVQNIIQKSLSAFILQQFQQYESSELMTRQLSRELLVLVYKCFYKSLNQQQKSMGIIAFQTPLHQKQQSSLIPKTKLSFIESIQLLTQLFEIIRIFLINQDVVVQKWFRIALKFMRANNAQLKQFVIINLKELYMFLGRSFPLGAFLQTYNLVIFSQQIQQTDDSNKTKRVHKQCQLLHTSPTTLLNTPTSTTIIPQNIDYHFLQKISLDLSLVEDEILNTLNITLQMFLQINGNSFVHVLSNLIKFKESSSWAQTVVTQLLSKWTQLKLPLLNTSNLYNRKSPIEKCKFQAFGIKRRQILKFEQYQKYKMLLQILCNLKDKQFLRQYYRNVNKKMQQINRQTQLKPYGVFLKKLLQKIKLSKQLIPQITMDLMEKSLMRLSQDYNEDTRMMDDSRRLLDVEEGKQNLVAMQQEVQSNGNIEKKDDEEGNSMKEQVNEFLAPQQQIKDKKLQKQDFKNSLQSNNDQLYNPLCPFTQQGLQLPQQQLQLLLQQQMQHHQILYLKIMRENHPKLLDYCCARLVESMNDIKEERQKKQDLMNKGLRLFLRQIKIDKYIGINQTSNIFNVLHKESDYSKANKQQFTWKFLIQLAFYIFGFRRTTRVRVKLIQTFFGIIQNSLKQQLSPPINVTSLNNQTTQQSPIKSISNMMRREMVYENDLAISRIINWNKHYENVYLRSERVANASNDRRTREQIVTQVLDNYHEQSLQNTIKINNIQKVNQQQMKMESNYKGKQIQKYQMKKIVKNQLEPYLVSFQIISDILQQINSSTTKKSIGFGLVEPISRVLTKVKQSQQNKQNNTQKPQYQIDKIEQQKQLAFLQMELQNYQKTRNDQLLLQNSKRKDSLKSPILSLTKSKVSSSLQLPSYTKKLPNQDLIFTSQIPPQFSKLSTTQLKQKINSRKVQLEEELRKKPKKIQNQNLSNRGNVGNRTKMSTPLGLENNDEIDQQTRKQVEQLISYNVDQN